MDGKKLSGMKWVFHWIHVVYALYIMIGGFLPYVNIYNWISALTIFGWLLFGRCIANDGFNYAKGSLTEEVFGEGGEDFFNSVLAIGQVFTAARTGNPMSLIVFIMCSLKKLNI